MRWNSRNPVSSARTVLCVLLLDPGRPSTREKRRFSARPDALALATIFSTEPSQAWASSRASVRRDWASSGAASTRPGIFRPVAGCWDGGLVTAGNNAAAAFGCNPGPVPARPAAANTAAAAPKPCPATASLVGCTLICPGPSRTPATMSSVVPRS